jgi:hypothetical protein
MRFQCIWGYYRVADINPLVGVERMETRWQSKMRMNLTFYSAAGLFLSGFSAKLWQQFKVSKFHADVSAGVHFSPVSV